MRDHAAPEGVDCGGATGTVSGARLSSLRIAALRRWQEPPIEVAWCGAEKVSVATVDVRIPNRLAISVEHESCVGVRQVGISTTLSIHVGVHVIANCLRFIRGTSTAGAVVNPTIRAGSRVLNR